MTEHGFRICPICGSIVEPLGLLGPLHPCRMCGTAQGTPQEIR